MLSLLMVQDVSKTDKRNGCGGGQNTTDHDEGFHEPLAGGEAEKSLTLVFEDIGIISRQMV